MPKPRLCCLGDLTLDIVVRASGTAALGTDVAASVSFRAGGSAANTARAFAALGGSAVFIGALGDDEVGGRLRAFMRSAGVTVHAPRVRGHTARLVVSVSPGGERSFLTDRGVADVLSVGSLRPAWLARADALHVPFYSFMAEPLASAAVAAVEMARPAAVISVDLASRGPLLALGRRRVLALLRDLAPDVLFANDDEAAVIVDAADVGAVARLAPIVVIKHGATGCTVINSLPSPTRSLIATKPISAIDTTGAGDAFDAGFLFALAVGGYRPAMKVDAALLRRAALAGHRSAARLLSSPRRELSL